MNETIISVENLGKKYSLRHKKAERYTALRDILADKAKNLFRRNGRNGSINSTREEFWALKDVSFEVRQGEVVGIIGRNGAGKSTLLKILSRITQPTTGRVRIKGRVASLLEVGTGFHPELTGRENIFLNGAILGMTRAEIRKKFDEIVAFAETEKFLDTPVKRYSSGMYVRLAFAVAAHLEPEILVIDEVLAVGDAEFQKKCLGKMGEVSRTEGRTVLFVSHNMAAISNLCSSALLLSKGEVLAVGVPAKLVELYLKHAKSEEIFPISERVDRHGSGRLRFTEFQVSDEKGVVTQSIMCGQNVAFHLCYETKDRRPVRNVAFSIGIYSILGHFVLFLENEMAGMLYESIPDHGEIICEIPRFPLAPGYYDVNIHCTVNGVQADWIRGARRLQVVAGDFFGTGKLPPDTHGGVLTTQNWKSLTESRSGQ
jgi:lipopolysaccharide transport system ATP-binding protein